MAEQNQFLALMEQEKPQILARLPEWLTPDRWWAMAYEMTKNPDLQKVAQSNPVSLLNAIKKIADWGLELDGEEAFINVYGGEAVAQSMYKGLIRRAVEAGVIAHAVADVVKEGDQVEIVSGSQGRNLIHRPAFGQSGGKRKIIGGYALFTLPNGLVDYELFEESDVEAVKQAALRMAQRRDKSAQLSPAWRFFEGEQVKKSVLRRGLKRFRGRRNDSDAAQRWSALQHDELNLAKPTEPEPPDDIPTATDGTQAPTPRRVKPEVVKPQEDRLLSDTEQNDCFDAWAALGGKATGLKKFLTDNYQRADLAEIKLSELDGLMASMQKELAA